MEGPKTIIPYLLVLFTFASLLPSSTAHIAEMDEYWTRRLAQAANYSLSSYEPNPEKIVTHATKKVGETLVESGVLKMENSTRRGLGKRYNGPCMVTNPIDKCWRCDPNWANNRKKLADCALGFGHKVTGGKDGPIYVVTDSSDNDMANPKPGTLRHAVTRNGPLWIIFQTRMSIRLNQELIMQGDKTIDGRGANVHIAYGAGITIQGVKNVIIHSIRVHDIVPGNGGIIRDGEDHLGLRTRSDGDGISLFTASNVWIDHVSMYRCSDGIIDAIQGSTGITISNSHFTDHNEVMLFGASDSSTMDTIMQVTVAFNHFGKRLIQRMPRCRFGFIHVLNNDYTHWQMYAIGGSKAPTIISQGNRFRAPNKIFKKEVTKREYSNEAEWKTWTWRSENDLMMNGAYFREGGDPQASKKYAAKFPSEVLAAQPGTAVDLLTKFAGAIKCEIGKPC